MDNSTTYDDDQLESERITFLQEMLGDDDAGELPAGLRANVFHLADKHSDWPNYWGAAEDSASRNGRRDVYLGLALMKGPGGGHERVKNETAAGLLALGKDIDIYDPAAHKEQHLPKNMDDVQDYLESVGPRPTLTVHSGHGAQCEWVFVTPWVFANDADRQRAARLAKAWDAYLNQLAQARGWKLDPTGDLARVLRIAGTLNAKVPDAVVPVRLLNSAPFPRYTPDDLAALLGGWDVIDTDTIDTFDDAGTNGGSLEPWQEYTQERPCPVCGGYEALPTGIGKRCWGYLHRDKVVAFCRRPEYARGLPEQQLGVGLGFAHLLLGECPCGVTHTPPRDAVIRFVISDLPLHALVDKTLAALRAANTPAALAGILPKLYVRGGILAWITRDEHQRPYAKEIKLAALRVEIDRIVRFYDRVGRKLEQVNPPQAVVEGVFHANAYPLPRLTGISETPLLRPDGALLSTVGYDEQTGWLYLPPQGAPAFPPIADEPSDAEIAAAFALLHEVICDFPFRTPADRANALGLLITLALRAVISGNIPLALIDATRAGTGKGLLADALAIIAIGHTTGTMTEGEHEAEWRKAITTELMTGRAFHIIDNVTQPLGAAALESLLTTGEYHDRLLTTNQQVSITGAARGVWCATGNNLTVIGDMPRRCYTIRMEATTATPQRRKDFKHPDLTEWVTTERTRILHALLTICHAWFARGKPTDGAPTVGSFQEWARVVWGVLQLDPTPVPDDPQGACYGAHFLGNAEELWEQSDPEALEWEAFLQALGGTYRDRAFTVAQLCEQVRVRYPDTYSLNDQLSEALPVKLLEFVSKDGLNKRMSHALRAHRGTRYGENPMIWLDVAGEDPITHRQRWRVFQQDTLKKGDQ